MSAITGMMGSTHKRTSAWLAERIRDELFQIRRASQCYEISMDSLGRVFLNRMGTSPESELLLVVNRITDPALIQEEIEAELIARGRLVRQAA